MSDVKTKRTDEVLDYVFDFGKLWLPTGDTISSVTVTVERTEGGATVIDSSSHDATTATVWVSGGIEGETATITVHVVTAGGRHKDAVLLLRIKDHS